MGLNVYFCDVCGVRVTDVDLRSGHGMLRGQDVICATCLEMGHGKEWLASRGVTAPTPPAASLSAPVAGNGSGHRPSANALIDHARDRAMTVEDHPSPVALIQDEDTGVAADRRRAANAEEVAEKVDEAADEELDPVFTSLRPSAPSADLESPVRRDSTSDFAGAAASFAALGSTAPDSDDEDVEDVEAESSTDVDPSLLRPGSSAAGSQETDEMVDAAERSRSSKEAGNKASLGKESPDKGSAVRGAAKSRSDRLRRSVSGVSGVSGARPGVGSGSRPSATKKTTSSSSVAGQAAKSAPLVQSSAKGSTSNSSRNSKPKTGRSKRGGAAGGGMPMPLKISLITIPLILVLALTTYVGPQLMRTAREPDVKDLKGQQAWIETTFATTKQTVNSAVGSKDLKTLQAANAAWIKFNDDFSRFCQSAKQYSKWTDDNCDVYSSQTLKIMDLSGRMKLIRDEMVKQQMQSH